MNNEDINVGWNFDNSYVKISEFFYSKIIPTPVRSPKIVKMNEGLAKLLGLNINELNSGIGTNIFAGNIIPKGAEPIAQAYAGHQFGHFTMLGDGRAILLGEHLTPEGERLDVQLKGSGLTPYSRGGDGRAVLGPMLREYIISEAMHELGIPTTRSLAVVTTGERVYRDNENRGAVLTRVASSHIRVGTFEYANRFGKLAYLKELADYTIKRHFPDIYEYQNRYLAFYREVIRRQAKLISQWQLVGFIHGVMNTDNMAISGETIDYGPCAFMDVYDINTVFSSIDHYGRYAYGNQPKMAHWNLARFGEALLPLLDDNIDQALKIANEEIIKFMDIYNEYWLAGMCKKLGLYNSEEGDYELVNELLEIMQTNKFDYTNTFIALTFENLYQNEFKSTEFTKWYSKYQARLARQNETKIQVQALMKANNPAIIPRNYFVEEALKAAVYKDDYTYMDDLLKALKEPFTHRVEQERYAIVVKEDCEYRTFCGT